MNARVQVLLWWALVALSGAAMGAEGQATFYRGINLNGPPLVIDGNPWDGEQSAHFSAAGNTFENQAVPLVPPTDDARAAMLRSSRWGGNVDLEFADVPEGAYHVFVYVWEDNDSTQFTLLLNGQPVVKDYSSGGPGQWNKLGPWLARVASDGKIRISARGGDANLSGIEVWSLDPTFGRFAEAPSEDDLAFFESKIRPLLVDNCYTCHSSQATELGGNLRLDSRPGIVRGGDSGSPILPGDAQNSLLVKAVHRGDPDLQMPPETRLAPEQIADLERWVRLRAPDPRLEEPAAAPAKYAIDWEHAKEFWSLAPIVEPPLPPVAHTDWPAGDLDRLLLARMEAAGLAPAADADRETLIRRATYDLIGLPPTPDQIDAFSSDPSPEAFAAVVDRLLASPQYGERWGRYWLDVVRYADTAGDNSDFPIPQIWRYRNWVIEAFNQDLPFDQFVREQLAGDLLGGDAPEQVQRRIIATGYLAGARRFGSRVDDYPQHLTIEDTLDNLGRAFLGTTINCARCHNHKFDPITTEDYYALYGIFHSTRYPWPGIELEQKQRDLVPLVPAEEVQRKLAEHRQRQEELDGALRGLEQRRDAAQDKEREQLEKEVREAREKAEAHSRTPPPFEQAYAVADAAKIEDAPVQQKGDPARPGPVVPRRFLTVLGAAGLSDAARSSGRLQLAEWIVDPGNPLTARVIANRIWLHHFGKGIVPTPNDFGRQGKPPTHPDVLDYLALRLVDSGWSIKSLHRTILLSRTYRQSSTGQAETVRIDPTNQWLAAFPRQRLDAEAIRDTLLTLGGHLDATPGGEHPFPPPAEWKFTQHNPFKAVYETNRRSVYLMTQRIVRHPYLAIFDGADPSVSTPARPVSTTPLQALYLLNDPFVHEQALGLARRLVEQSADENQRLTLAYRLALGRRPAVEERELAGQFLAAVRAELAQSASGENPLEVQAWHALARAIFRLNEFVYID